jgi:hypothetical protein
MAGRGLAKKTTDLMAACAAILEEIQPTSVRGVCYQLFVQGRQIPSMSVRDTKRVSSVLTKARELGVIPWEWIVDETRQVQRWQTWSTPSEYADTVMNAYAKDWWAEQPQRLLVISEKGTVGGVLRPVLGEYRVPFLVVHGWSSATAVKNLANVSVADERPLTLLYVGDHDPSGRRMSDVDIPERMGRYGGVADLLRLAVTQNHIANLDLPTFSVHEKSKDANYRWFLETYGETCCELDALNPNALRDVVEGAITDRIAWDRWHDAQADECGEREAIRENLKLLKEAMWV